MRQLLILLFLCLLIVSCGHTSLQDKVLLARADSLMEAHPDSALALLQHITDLLDTSENTVNVNRSAIRKKLKIEGKTDLTDFLFHF